MNDKMESPYKSPEADRSHSETKTPIPQAEIVRPRKPWVAVLFSFLALGLGHVYCGRFTRGIKFFGFYQLQLILIVIALLLPA